MCRSNNCALAQLAAFTASPTVSGVDPVTNTTGCRLPLTLTNTPNSIPKPRGSAGGGQRGYHLQEAMGLTGPEDDRLYNMILVSSLFRRLLCLILIVIVGYCARACSCSPD